MAKITLDRKDDEQMNKVAEYMWYTKEELKVSLEVLEFLKKCGFDLIPQYITDMILDKISKDMFDIPWLKLNTKNIDIKRGNFWESWIKKTKLTLEAKVNLVKFVNKAITWYIDVPLKTDEYAKWENYIDKDKFIEFCDTRWLITNKEKDLWNHHQIVQNLKSNTINYNQW